MKKRVLVYNGYYLPSKNYGGPTSSLVSIVENCSDEFDFYIIAANHDFNSSEVFQGISSGWNNVGKAKVLYLDLKETYFNIKRNREIIEEVLPDVVWFMGILVPYDKWFVAKLCRKLKIPYILSPRGEVCDNAIRIKPLKKRLVIVATRLLRTYKSAWYHATCQEEINGLIKYYHIKEERVFYAPNIPNNLHGTRKESNKVSGCLNAVYISRIHETKNLLLAICAINKLPGNVKFDIFGPIESSDYWERCQTEINCAPKNVHIRYCGVLDASLVTKTFGKYDCFVLPTLSENFGHVIAEALSADCPVVLSKGTTPWDDLDRKAGFTCNVEKVDSFTESLLNILNMDENEYQRMLDSTYEYYTKKMDEFDSVQKHINMLNSVIENKQS